MHFYSLRLRYHALNRISRNGCAQRILLKHLDYWICEFVSLLSIDVTFVFCKSLRRLPIFCRLLEWVRGGSREQKAGSKTHRGRRGAGSGKERAGLEPRDSGVQLVLYWRPMVGTTGAAPRSSPDWHLIDTWLPPKCHLTLTLLPPNCHFVVTQVPHNRHQINTRLTSRARSAFMARLVVGRTDLFFVQ